MRNYESYLFCLLALSGCLSKKSEIPVVTDTVSVTKSARTPPASGQVNAFNYHDNPVRDLDNFSVGINYPEYLNILKEVTSNKNYVVTNAAVFEWGDCGGTARTYANSKNKSLFYQLKSDCGDYGFGNEQFFFRDTALQFARDFGVMIEQFPGDSTEQTVFKMEEKVYVFRATDAVVKTRQQQFENSNRYSLEGIPFTETIVNGPKLEQELKKKFKGLKELENNSSH